MKIIVGVSGASGVGMSLMLLKELKKKDCEIHLVVSDGAKETWEYECTESIDHREPEISTISGFSLVRDFGYSHKLHLTIKKRVIQQGIIVYATSRSVILLKKCRY